MYGNIVAHFAESGRNFGTMRPPGKKEKRARKNPRTTMRPLPWSGYRAPSARGGQGAGVGVGMLRGAGDSLN